MENKSIIKGYLYAVMSATIYGLMPMMAKFIYADGVSSLCLVFLRSALALPVLAFCAYGQQKTLKAPMKSVLPISCIALLGGTVTPILLFYSYQYIPSGIATVFHFIYPAVVVLLGVLLFRRKAEREKIISAVICIAGVSLFYTPGGSLDLRGSLAALASGITFALYVLLLSSFKDKKISGFLFNFYGSLSSSIAAGIILIVLGDFNFPTTLKGWLFTIFFSVVITVGAVGLFQQGTFLIGGEKTSVLSTVELMVGVIMGIIVFHEKVSISSAFGSILVFSAGVFIAMQDMKKAKKNKN